MLHFFFGIPRLILIAAPLTFLLLGAHPIKADALAVGAYILPHIALSALANSKLSRRFRHSFWGAVYELSIAPFVAGVTLLALLNPKLGKFNVTEKGENADRARFDFRYGGGTLALLLLSVIGLGIAFPLRLLWYCAHPGDPSQLDSIVLNSLWALANLILLVATACAALEQPQQRRAPRLKRRYCCELITDEESDPISCETVDISESGVRVRLDALVPLPAYCRLVLKSGTAFVNLQAERVTYDWAQRRTGRSFAVADFSLSAQNVQASFKFNGLDPLAHRQLIELLFTADGCWNEQEYDEDRLLTSFWHLLTTFWRATRSRRANLSPAPTLKGTWPAWVGETPCTCTAISGAHAIVARSNSSSVKSEGSGKLGSAFTIEVTPGRKLTVPLGVSSASAGQQRLDFVWNSSNQERDFWQALYGKLADEPPARFSMVQRLLADLR
jgi:hypothetical protein